MSPGSVVAPTPPDADEHVWILQVTELDGTARAFLDGLDFTITRRLNGGVSAKLNVESRDDVLEELTIGDSAVKAYRDNDLRFYGRVWEPMVWNATMVNVLCEDSWAHVENRRVDGSAADPFEAEYQEVIAWTLISNAMFDPRSGDATPIRIRQATGGTQSVRRDRTYEVGKPIGEAIRELAGVVNGFYFHVDPVDDDSDAHCEFVTTWPNAGVDRDEVKFEFGEGTLANLDDFELTQYLPRNQIRARGSSTGGSVGTTEGLTTIAQGTASYQQYDLIEEEVTFATVELLETLQEHANEELQVMPVEVFKLTPGVEAPMLWDDFDVGDTVRFTIINGSLQRGGTVLITEATVAVSNNGQERLESLVIQFVD